MCLTYILTLVNEIKNRRWVNFFGAFMYMKPDDHFVRQSTSANVFWRPKPLTNSNQIHSFDDVHSPDFSIPTGPL